MDASVETRFWAKVLRRGPDECWSWTGAHDTGGYAVFSMPKGRSHTERAHRITYELLVGPIPDGYTIDHLCRNRPCINPAHLEPVTRGENVRRGLPFRTWKVQEYCERGLHLLAETRGAGHGCRTCHNAQSLAKYHATHVPKVKIKPVLCRNGHVLTDERAADGSCVICRRATANAYYHRHRDEVLARRHAK